MSKFKDVQSNVSFADLEKQILESWNKNKIFEQVESERKGSESKVYYDGPITANNLPHYGHAITWAMKDVVPRFWTMSGYYVSRNMGWDCQGIPVEYEVEKKQGFQSKSDIENFGVAKFNELCRQSVLEYRDAMAKYERRMGRWIDETDSYETMASDYIESVWWSLKELHNKGLLYEGHKVVAYSTRAGTTLSNAEVALGGYKEIIDPAITVKFEIKDQADTYFLAWTTTPWTIPGNLMLSVGKNIQYVKVEHEGKFYILASECVDRIFKDKEGYKVVEDVSADSLVGMEYNPPFDYFAEKKEEGAFKVVYADHVNTEEGTGIVHLAPYGNEDFEILTEMNISLFDYLDDLAHFNELVKDLEGKFYKSANKDIMEILTSKDLLFYREDYPHQMPMCWRTDTPLIYKPIKSWYVAVTKIKDQLIAENEKVNWIPENVKTGRFGTWIENARDWALSRSRYWGTPLPVWVNDKTGEAVVIGSFEELEKLSGQKLAEDFDPHKPFVDEITWGDDSSGVFRRVSDVIDVWYDSGSMPFAQYHYPFENKELFEQRFPADYISESSDQTRGWFYTLMVINVALFGKSPYKSVVMSGMLGDEEGKKLSKSKNNYPPMEEVLDSYGADILRYFLLTSTVVRGGTARFSNRFLEESKKEFFVTLWNSYRYFVTYANVYDFVPSGVGDFEKLDVLDQWILIRLNQVVKNMHDYMDKKEVMYAARELAPFVDDLSNWYIRRSRDRISDGNQDALNVLYYVLLNFSKAIAPLLPFVSEEMYLNLTSVNKSEGKASVHLELFPEVNEQLMNKDLDVLLDQMIVARSIASVGNAIRKQHSLPVRQPLSEMIVSGGKDVQPKVLDLVKDELNVKSIKFDSKLPEGDSWVGLNDEAVLKAVLNTEITEELKVEGTAREIMREIQKLRKDADVAWDAKIKIEYPSSDEYDKAIGSHADEIKSKIFVIELVKGDEFKVL